ncbi:hypothetical protein Tco_1467143 [Tanacetum coccineum]
MPVKSLQCSRVRWVLCRKQSDMHVVLRIYMYSFMKHVTAQNEEDIANKWDASGVARVLIWTLDMMLLLLGVREVYADPSYASTRPLSFCVWSNNSLHPGVTENYSPALKIIEAYIGSQWYKDLLVTFNLCKTAGLLVGDVGSLLLSRVLSTRSGC